MCGDDWYERPCRQEESQSRSRCVMITPQSAVLYGVWKALPEHLQSRSLLHQVVTHSRCNNTCAPSQSHDELAICCASFGCRRGEHAVHQKEQSERDAEMRRSYDRMMEGFDAWGRAAFETNCSERAGGYGSGAADQHRAASQLRPRHSELLLQQAFSPAHIMHQDIAVVDLLTVAQCLVWLSAHG